MAELLYRLTFNGALYVGIGGDDREQSMTYVPSDTLFGALVIAWRALKLLPSDLAGLPLRLTSAFPFAGPVRFFPRPLPQLNLPASLKPKAIKRVEWVSEQIFEALRQK